MIENIFKNIAYLYYPRGICNINENEKYLNSDEFKRLSIILNSFNIIDVNNKSIELIEKEFTQSNILSNFQNMTSFSFDRSLSYVVEILESDKTLIKICVNISIIIPYYTIYVLENKIELNPYKWITMPTRVKEKEKTHYKQHIDEISSILKKVILYNPFPDELIDKVIDDIAFQDNKFGDFTFFNAFFQDGDNIKTINI
jgi:hypothetical protein